MQTKTPSSKSWIPADRRAVSANLSRGLPSVSYLEAGAVRVYFWSVDSSDTKAEFVLCRSFCTVQNGRHELLVKLCQLFISCALVVSPPYWPY